MKSLPPVPPEERNNLELIRFTTKEDEILAIGVLRQRGMMNFSSTGSGTWAVWTPVARKLREVGVPFEWLTENA
jgi:hypothetical protein